MFLQDFKGDFKPCPRPKLLLVVKSADRVITVHAKVRGRVEENTGRALVIAAPILFSETAYIGPAKTVAVPVYGDRPVLRLGGVRLKNCEGQGNGKSDPVVSTQAV